MNIKNYFHWFYQLVCNYNLFIPEPNDYDDDDDDDEQNERRNPEFVVKYQKYTTRLYVLLLIVKFNEIKSLNSLTETKINSLVLLFSLFY